MPKKEYKVVDLFLWLWRHDARHEKNGQMACRATWRYHYNHKPMVLKCIQPDLHTLNKMAKVLNVNIKDLIIDK